MAHNDITFDDGFHQTDFVDSLQYIDHEILPDSVLIGTNLEASLIADATGSGTANVISVFRGFLAEYTESGEKKFTNWTAFEINWQAYVRQWGFSYNFSLTGTQNLYNFFKNGFREATIDNWATDPARAASGIINPNSDFAVLIATPNPLSLNYNALNTTNPFLNAFNHFLSEFDYTDPAGTAFPNGTATDHYVSNFLNQLKNFYATTASLQDPDNIGALPSPSYEKLPSYEAIYMAFGPSPFDRNQFIADLKEFYNQQLATNGYFLPSQSFGAWLDVVRKGNFAINNFGTSSLDGNSSEKALILNRILILLIKIIGTLQDVGIAQANRLQFITQYQQAYTSLQTQIPVFTRDENSPIGGDSKEEGETRNALNTSVNGIFTDNIRALRGLQEDAGKKLQSNVNQTNDAVNQQTDMATTFIQQMSSLLTTILR